MNLPIELQLYAADYLTESSRMPISEAIVRYCAKICHDSPFYPSTINEEQLNEWEICENRILHEFGLTK